MSFQFSFRKVFILFPVTLNMILYLLPELHRANLAKTFTGDWKNDNFAFNICTSNVILFLFKSALKSQKAFIRSINIKKKLIIYTYKISSIFTLPMLDMSKSLKLSLMLTGPVPWSIPNAVIRNGSIGDPDNAHKTACNFDNIGSHIVRVCLAKSKKISERSTRGLCLTQCRLHIDQLRALRPFYWIHKGIVPSTFLSLSSILLPLIYKATQNIDYRKAADIVRV
ncbi:hypothetical protein AGLY_011673 [Aphis glycines]|uniref:Uncharacterized protein n=1 Tax=Aphis glycines TaxID=307491 RepID=A0A6G0TC68_APHGL|nr:hypothetical protein AGLY_011673 [Aphis glycines]